MAKCALIVIDVQMGFAHRDASGEPRSCVGAEDNISHLLAVFRARNFPIVHVHHHSNETGSVFTKGTAGAEVQEFAKPQSGEQLIVKNVNSAFIGTDLEQQLNALGNPQLVICGATANHCVETSTRMAGNLGFDAIYVSDAVWAYGCIGPDGAVFTADQVHSMSMANLDGEFAQVLSTETVIRGLN